MISIEKGFALAEGIGKLLDVGGKICGGTGKIAGQEAEPSDHVAQGNAIVAIILRDRHIAGNQFLQQLAVGLVVEPFAIAPADRAGGQSNAFCH